MTAYTHILNISPQSGEFLINADLIGDMDPFVRVTIGKETKQTETAYNQGKTPVWKNTLSFKLTADQVAQPGSVVMLIEAFDEDPGSEDFLGKTTFTLAQMKEKIGGFAILELTTGANKPVGTISVQFELKKDTTAPSVQKTSTPAKKTPHKTTTQKTPELVVQQIEKTRFTKIVGTIVVKLSVGKLDVGVSDIQKLYLVFVHGESAFKTNSSEGPGRKPVFKDAISMPLYENEDMTIRVFDANVERSSTFGEGKINLYELATKNNYLNSTVPLYSGKQKVGEMTVNFEFFSETFDNPVRVFPVISVKKGEFINKKVRYNNLENIQKNLIIRTEDKDLVFIKNQILTLPPKGFVEIRFKIFAPVHEAQANCKVDVIVEEMKEIEESLLFRVKNV